jgi:crotonobetainyl-CoA:carnitine CoA-transferase CaiB-like acyl-CoA transferase
VLDTQELVDEPSFRRRGILQTMVHGERTMTMPTWPVRFDGVPTVVKSAPDAEDCSERAVARN